MTSPPAANAADSSRGSWVPRCSRRAVSPRVTLSQSTSASAVRVVPASALGVDAIASVSRHLAEYVSMENHECNIRGGVRNSLCKMFNLQ